MSINTLFPNHGKPRDYYMVCRAYRYKDTKAEKDAKIAVWQPWAKANPNVKLRGHLTREAAQKVFDTLPAEVQAVAEVAQYSPL